MLELRLLSFNVMGMELWQSHCDLAVEELRELDVDIMFLQELGGDLKSTPSAQVCILAENLGFDYKCTVPYSNKAAGPKVFAKGLAVLSKYPFDFIQIIPLPVHKDDSSRIALLFSVSIGRHKIHCINLHLSWRPEDYLLRMKQVDHLMSHLKILDWLNQSMYLIIAGDFNATEDEYCIKAMDAHFIDCYQRIYGERKGFTWLRSNQMHCAVHQNLPDRRVDYIWCTKNFEIRQAHILLDEPCKQVSDHFALSVDLALPHR
jgi:endonuclease/exonuclease/phosphatase family metal-dependent hydrolase